MKLESKCVRFYRTFLQFGLYRVPVRFAGKGSTLQLQETALVVEGNLLKVGLLGFENYFRAVLSEWSVFTVPYSRIERVKRIRFPVLRIVGLLLMLVGGFFGAFFAINAAKSREIPFELLLISLPFLLLGALLFFYVQPRLTLKIRRADGKVTQLLVGIRPRRVREEFLRKLHDYRLASARFGGGELPGDLAELDGLTEERAKRIRSRDRGIRRGLYLAVAVGVVSIVIGSMTKGPVRGPLSGAYSHCFSIGDVVAAFAETPSGRSEGFIWFIRLLEWIVAPLVLLIFLFPPSYVARCILAAYAALRLFETLYGLYGLYTSPSANGGESILSGVLLLVFVAVFLWWLRRLTASVEAKEGSE